jgi:hypothetical protein
MEEVRNANKTLVRKPEEERSLGRPRWSWEDNIKWILKKQIVRIWTEFIWLKKRSSKVSCEHSNQPLGSIKSG